VTDSATSSQADGVHALPPRENWDPAACKLRDTYAITPDAPIFHREFGWYCMDKWTNEQGLTDEIGQQFGFDPPGHFSMGELGWCEAAFRPTFEDKVLEDRGEHELVQDHAGRSVLVFKGRRSGFMPEYLDHPVKDRKTWQENVKWRLDPAAPGRFDYLADRVAKAKDAAARGLMITQNLIGGYMYLRSLMGPEDLMYAWYDQPDLVHDCMQTWLTLADAVTARHQEHVTFDEVFLAEDICYNHGILCSPETMKEFLLPYYQQLLSNIRSRQIDTSRHVYVQIDTDGDCRPTIPIYHEAIGMDAMSPFEVASGCDVVEIAQAYPWLVMPAGGIDKRELAKGKDAIDRMVDRIIPPMRKRGGYIPTCDHGVPDEVDLEDYLHYRKRMLELGG
jgi:uroporphyrinogen decarboxylase